MGCARQAAHEHACTYARLCAGARTRTHARAHASAHALGWVGGWVGGLGWVGLGWVGLGWVGLGWAGLGRWGVGGWETLGDQRSWPSMRIEGLEESESRGAKASQRHPQHRGAADQKKWPRKKTMASWARQRQQITIFSDPLLKVLLLGESRKPNHLSPTKNH